MDTQKQDADENEFAEIAENMTTKVTKLISSQMNICVQTVEKDTWKIFINVKWQKKRVIEKFQADSSVGRRRSLQILAGE